MVVLKLHPQACCGFTLTANDSTAKQLLFLFFFFFLPARPPALKRLKAARQRGGQSSSKAPFLCDVWAVVGEVVGLFDRLESENTARLMR